MAEELAPLDAECFFIAPIGDEGSKVRDRSDGVLEFIVGRAAEELGLVAVRGDHIAQPGQITIQVLEHVLGARAAVADLTGQNPNVFYELAVRHTARLPTVLICDRSEKLPFDIAQMRTVKFDHTDLRSSDSCRRAIVAHLREAFDGAVDSPIATTVDVRALQGGNTMERSLAELVERVDGLTREQHGLMGVLQRRNNAFSDWVPESRNTALKKWIYQLPLTTISTTAERDLLEVVLKRLLDGPPLTEDDLARIRRLASSRDWNELDAILTSQEPGVDSSTLVGEQLTDPGS